MSQLKSYIVALPLFSVSMVALAMPSPSIDGGFSASVEAYKPYVKEKLYEGKINRLMGLSVDYDHAISQSRFMRWHFYRTVEHKKADGEHKGVVFNFSKDREYEMRAGADYAFNLNFSDHTKITPHAGLQYREFVHSDKESVTRSYNNQKAHYTMAPVGVDITTRLSGNWGLSFSGEYQYLIYGQQVAYTSDHSLILPTLDDIKANGHGTKIGADVLYHWDHARLSVGASLQSWEVETDTKSAQTARLSEGFMPSNQESQIGVHARFFL